MSLSILSRPAKPEDLSYVYDTWLNTWRGSPWAGVIPNHLYFDVQRSTIAGLLGRGAEVRVAHFGPSPDLIQGWVCFEIDKSGVSVLHYLYTRDPYMLPGITAHFMDTAIGHSGLVTHLQHNKQVKKWKHCPEIARRKSL